MNDTAQIYNVLAITASTCIYSHCTVLILQRLHCCIPFIGGLFHNHLKRDCFKTFASSALDFGLFSKKDTFRLNTRFAKRINVLINL